MKTLFSLIVLFLSLGYVTPMTADFQSENQINRHQLNAKEDKIYIPFENLYFSNEGIFLLIKNDQWIAVNQLGYDSSGYYLARGIPGMSSYIATCKNCGAAYSNRRPQPCEVCKQSKGFDFIYEDIYDRN